MFLGNRRPTIINREQILTGASAVLLVICRQLFCTLQLYGQQVDLDAAAAAKTLTIREALTHAPIDLQGPKSVGDFVTFDVPGAGTTGTLPSSMNAEGEITGIYYDVNSVGHGFLRSKNGTFTTFDVTGLTSTSPTSISESARSREVYVYTNDVIPWVMASCDSETALSPPLMSRVRH